MPSKAWMDLLRWYIAKSWKGTIYKKLLRKSKKQQHQKISFLTIDLFTEVVTAFLPTHDFPLLQDLESILALYCKYFLRHATFSEAA